jgi:hypothetical protein
MLFGPPQKNLFLRAGFNFVIRCCFFKQKFPLIYALSLNVKLKVKMKSTLEQATKA